jgi:hypothetical protein
MRDFFAGPAGSMLKTFIKAFLAAAIVAASGLVASGEFGLDATTAQAVAIAGVLGALAVAATWLDPTDGRYGLGK